MSTVNFVSVWMKSGNNEARQAKFTESIMDALCEGRNTGRLYSNVQEHKLTISDAPLVDEDKSVVVQRPSFCPVSNLTPEVIAAMPSDTLDRGIHGGAAVLLESCDGRLLLTRRAAHLRTFPNVWVPPGGHIEYNETFTEAALREMKEEVGLNFTASDFSSLQKIGMWESVFPTKLSFGLPRRHHLVCYIHARLAAPHTADALSKHVTLDAQEVGAYAWIERQVAAAIADACEEGTKRDVRLLEGLTETIKIHTVASNGKLTVTSLDTNILTSVVSDTGANAERVSTGTKFALSQWLQVTSTNQS